ncbi:hypothetical protein TFLX_02537 [Thermoflexales bacterium]|nr:hypothetical protein TFLX_02537 [Thermoflexales bacterium]
MKVRIVIVMITFVLLLSVSVALAQSQEPGYHLTHLTWQVSGATSSTQYRLESPNSPVGAGTQCCCSYLPCVMRAP